MSILQMRSTIVIIIIATLITSCSVTKKSSQRLNDDIALENKLLFLTIKVNKGIERPEFDIIDQKVVDGKLKRPMPETLRRPDHFVCEFKGSDDQILARIAVENPLTKVVEAPNENGSFKKAQIDLDSSSFVIRLQYSAKMEKLVISYDTGEVLKELTLKK